VIELNMFLVQLEVVMLNIYIYILGRRRYYSKFYCMHDSFFEGLLISFVLL
jgi:hypothetical protein